MRIFPLMLGDTIQTPAVPNNEPYRVLWNPTVIYNDQSTYFKQENRVGFKSVAYNTAILTDHDPLNFRPEMLCTDLLPLDITIMGYPILTATRPKYPIVGMRINKLNEFAPVNRANKLPKVFQLRFVSTAAFLEMDLLRINLDASGTKYIALRILRNTNTLIVRLRECVDGVTIRNSDYVEMEDIVSGAVQSDTIRLAIFKNRIEFLQGDPGVAKAQLSLPMSLIDNTGAFLEVIHEDYLEDGQQTPVIYGIDGLYIYDGYF